MESSGEDTDVSNEETPVVRRTVNPDKMSNEEKLSLLSSEFKNLRYYYTERGMSDNTVRNLLQDHIRCPESFPDLVQNDSGDDSSRMTSFMYVIILIACSILGAIFFAPRLLKQTGLLPYLTETECLLETNMYFMEITRPQFDCSICESLKEIPVVVNISKDDFKDKYAFTAVPVLIKDATSNWTAMETFSYDYFKGIYTKDPEILKAVVEECQFFPYNTEFRTLSEVFNMKLERAHYEDGQEPWYIGW